jgi:chaperonin GroEL
LVANRERGLLDEVVAVRAPSVGHQRAHILEDLAVITGGRCINQERQDRLANVTIADLGKARQAWATRFAFGILGGQGSKAAIRQRISEARAELRAADRDDAYTTSKIQERIGKLAGTAVTIHVGAATRAEQQDLKLRVEAAVRSARAAVSEGVVAGGGLALLACVPALEAMDIGGDERVGVAALAHALAEPLRAIVRNAGVEAEPIVARALGLARAGERPQVFDVLRQDWVDPWSTGIVDPLSVVQAALETSVSMARLALSAEVLVRRKNAPRAVAP